MVNFHYAITQALLLYGIEGDLEDMEEIGLVAYQEIGNKNTRLYRAVLEVNDEGYVELPCNCDIIEAVTYCGFEDWNYTSNTKENGEPESLYTENKIEYEKCYKNPLYLSGKYVKYRREGLRLYIVDGKGPIQILYHGILLDEDGLPELTNKEALAIADYIAYAYKYKEAIRTSNQNTYAIAQDIRKTWIEHRRAARVPEYISQNDMNQILDALSSWDRKIYNKSYKPVK